MRKVCEREMSEMVCKENNSTARSLEKLVLDEFLCKLWVRSVSDRVSGRNSQREVIYGDLF